METANVLREILSLKSSDHYNTLRDIMNELEKCPWYDEYQKWVTSKVKKDFATFTEAITCSVLGLCGESGELADLVKKKYFHNKEIARDKVVKEFGDVLFYLAAAADQMGISLSEIVEQNIVKLNARYPNGFDSTRAHATGDIPIEEKTNESQDMEMSPFPQREQSILPLEGRSSKAQNNEQKIEPLPLPYD